MSTVYNALNGSSRSGRPMRDDENFEIVSDEPVSDERKSKLVKLIDSIAGNVTLFHAAGHVAYACIPVAEHLETWAIKSSTFRLYVRKECWRLGIALRSEDLREITNLLEARALFDGVETDVHLRVASVGDDIWIDLCDSRWRAIRITSDGWEVVERPPVRFRREVG